MDKDMDLGIDLFLRGMESSIWTTEASLEPVSRKVEL